MLNYNEFITEKLGERNVVYPFKKDAEHENNKYIDYLFTNKFDTEYKVVFMLVEDEEGDYYVRNFTTKKGFEETGEGDILNVINTISAITADFINEYQPSEIHINHIASKNEIDKMLTGDESDEDKNRKIAEFNVDSVSKRAKVNRLFLLKHLPKNYSYRLEGSNSILSKNI